MDVSAILDPLNDAQREAVCAPSSGAGSNTLVLAGAGSGKTRVLVHRIAWLLQAEGMSPYSILAVTFTNKAAGEMRGRLENLVGLQAGGLWVGTFHGIAHRLLRAHWQEANLPQSFQILDSEDQLRAIRRLIRDMGLDENQWPAKEAQWFINARKDEGLRPDKLSAGKDVHLQYMIEIYKQYDAMCQRAGLIDFNEMLLRAKELWEKRPDVLMHYQQRFRNVLVDEFQDTNFIQYEWLKLLVGENNALFAVGDDDQSIYGWRGAKVENLHQLQHDFKNVSVFRLEQNYRSTGTILAAANALIANNTTRMGKELWTAGSDGELIDLYAAFNDLDEANYIVDSIQKNIEQGQQRSENAILYRSNAQSRVLEEALIQRGIPYRVYGGLRFFERQEIKDALAYLRLIANRDDDAAFERVVNTPTRGIGNKTIETLRTTARSSGMTLWQAAAHLRSTQELTARALNALTGFMNLIEAMAEEADAMTLEQKIEYVIHESTLYVHYEKEKGEKGQARLENLDELVQAGSYFAAEAEKQGEASNGEPGEDAWDELSEFLSHAALEAGEAQADEWDDCVQLMTLHSAKGLEFKNVFMCGVEEGLFPHHLSAEDPSRLEEERRLCYVGMTRACEKLVVTYAEKRRMYGDEIYPVPSRFIKEMPKKFMQQIRMKGEVSMPFAKTSVEESIADYNTNDGSGFNLGQRVSHAKFGEGVVLNYEGEGRHARVQVNFEMAGNKWLMVEYANLSVV